MNAIFRIALEAKGFKEDMIDNIMTIAEATGNTIVAMEVLLGVFVAPDIVQYSKQSDKVCTFVSHDIFTDKVEYSYEYEETKTAY